MATASEARTEIRIKGVTMRVPSVDVAGRRIVVKGTRLRVAEIFDEELIEGDPAKDPATLIRGVKESSLKADLFTFRQRPPDGTPRFSYSFEWDNWAVAPTSSFKDWWEGLPQESRKNVRRSAKKGVTVQTATFDDGFVRGIQGVYNETPVRQGKKFWHYGKDFETVKMENETYLERSEFIGAYFEETLIGFIKIIYVDRVAYLIQIIAKNEHQDKRPMNALLAHAIEVSEHKGMTWLVYGKYVYGKKNDSSLTEFKRRNGFEQVNFPQYFVPLTLKGKIAVSSGVHLGPGNLLPKPVEDLLLAARARLLKSWSHVTSRRSLE